MASVERVPVPAYKQRYSMEELIGLRRTILRAARSLPRGPERNYKIHIEQSLRTLFKDQNWLDAHLTEDQPTAAPSSWIILARHGTAVSVQRP